MRRIVRKNTRKKYAKRRDHPSGSTHIAHGQTAAEVALLATIVAGVVHV